jgi:hypothetical protein
VKVTTHELLLLVLAVRVQGFGSTRELESEGLMAKPTVPCGELLVPLVVVSVTVTVQLSGLLAGTWLEGGDGFGQAIVVEVVRTSTTTVSVPLLPAWIVPGAGRYVAVMV